MTTRPTVRYSRRAATTTIAIAMLYLVALVAFVLFALPAYGTMDRLLAWCIFVLGTAPVIAFVRAPRGAPLIEFVALQYAVMFALPVFFEASLGTLTSVRIPTAEALTGALWSAFVALACLLLGYHLVASAAPRRPVRLLTFPASDVRLYAAGSIMAVGSLSLFLGGVDIPEQARQPVAVILSQDLGIALLALLHYRGACNRWQSAFAKLTLAASVLAGLIGGMTQFALQPVLVWMLCRWLITRRAPTKTAVALAMAFFVMQPVKGAYRQLAWSGSASYTMQEKLSLYGSLLRAQWSETNTSSSDVVGQVQRSAAQRLSLLMATAHYIELTPGQVDYKNGSTLMYMVYTWVPRFIWRNKPAAQIANTQMPVEYGLQSSASAKTTMFGVGHVAETYANFGAWGIAPVFLIIGCFYFIPGFLIGNAQSTAALAIGVAVTMNIMWIGSTIGHTFGGVIQQIVVQTAILRATTMTSALHARRRENGHTPPPLTVRSPS